MALIVEDGTCKPNAQSWASVAEWKDYFSKRGNATAAALSDTVIEQKLVLAADYIKTNYGDRFKGVQIRKEQALPWPRYGAWIHDDTFLIDATEIPAELKFAQIEVGWAAVDMDISPNVDVGDPQITTEIVGPIEVQYDVSNSSKLMQPILRTAEGWLRLLLERSSNTKRLVRS